MSLSKTLLCTTLSCAFYVANAVTLETGVLRIGAPANHIPFAGFEKTSTSDFVGYGVDISKEICKRLNVRCEFYYQTWGTMISSVRFNKYDYAIGGMSITPDRLRVIDFTHPISVSPAQFAIRKGHPLEQKLVALKGFIGLNQLDAKEKQLYAEMKSLLSKQKVAVMAGTNHLKYIQTDLPKLFNIVIVKDTEAMLEAMNKGEADFGISDASGWVGLDKAGKLSKITASGPLFNEGQIGDGVGFPIRRGSGELLQKVNAELDKMRADGTMTTLSGKWGLPAP